MPEKEWKRVLPKLGKALAITAAVLLSVGYMKSTSTEPPSNPTTKAEESCSPAQHPDPWTAEGRQLWSSGSIRYKNKKYGLRVKLPISWKGYKVSIYQWGDGPEIHIQHPKSTQDSPWQDIPIMVFTLPQWDMVERGEIVVSAAPVGPSELARNRRYVFALPARYNYADAEGQDEVALILASGAVEAF